MEAREAYVGVGRRTIGLDRQHLIELLDGSGIFPRPKVRYGARELRIRPLGVDAPYKVHPRSPGLARCVCSL